MTGLYLLLVAMVGTVLVLSRLARAIGARVARWIEPPLPRARVRRR
jgi:hypothetical protein